MADAEAFRGAWGAGREEGVYDDTLVIYTSGHGDMLEDHDLFATMYTAADVTLSLMQKYMQLTAWRDRQYNMSKGGLSPMPSFAFLHK